MIYATNVSVREFPTVVRALSAETGTSVIFQDAYVAGLSATGAFTLCEVGHNAPAHMQAGPKLAWYPG